MVTLSQDEAKFVVTQFTFIDQRIAGRICERLEGIDYKLQYGDPDALITREIDAWSLWCKIASIRDGEIPADYLGNVISSFCMVEGGINPAWVAKKL